MGIEPVTRSAAVGRSTTGSTMYQIVFPIHTPPGLFLLADGATYVLCFKSTFSHISRFLNEIIVLTTLWGLSLPSMATQASPSKVSFFDLCEVVCSRYLSWHKKYLHYNRESFMNTLILFNVYARLTSMVSCK